MKGFKNKLKNGFTLLETVIAIGVLAVLLTGFMVVFAPAAAGIRKSINVQEADRLASTVEQELVTLREPDKTTGITTGFDKAFYRIKGSTGQVQAGKDAGDPKGALLVYQYRGKMSDSLRADNTPAPQVEIKGMSPGKDYTVIPMMRRQNDPLFQDDLKALEGNVFLVKCVQLVFKGNGMEPIDVRGTIKNPKPSGTTDPDYKAGPFTDPADYPEAVIAFTADFYSLPSRAPGYFSGAAFGNYYKSAKTPVFSRNLAVRR